MRRTAATFPTSRSSAKTDSSSRGVFWDSICRDGWSSHSAEFSNIEEFLYIDMSRYDKFVKHPHQDPDSAQLLKTLADFRYELRRFLHFSERVALDAGLQPQQHQLLLQVAGAADGLAVTIAYAADRLGLKHNSTVELVDRSEREGLLIRVTDSKDKRRMILRLTAKGKRLLERLSNDHANELKERAPRLIEALENVTLHADAFVEPETR
jgi:DNA-binding MarR family transcriptional regulator